MTVKEVIERIKIIGLQATGKEIRVDRHRLQDFLRSIGAVHKRGTKEWLYNDVSPEILADDIYKHVYKIGSLPKKKATKAKKKRTNEQKNLPTNEQKHDKIKEQQEKPTKEGKSTMRKRASFDINNELLKELKIHAIKEEKNVYEIVEQAISTYLKEQAK